MARTKWWHRRYPPALIEAAGASHARARPAPFREALTASARIVNGTDERTAKLTREGWHSVAWDYYGSVGEAHYSANFVGSCYSRCGLRLALLDHDGNRGPAFREAEDADVSAGRAEQVGDPVPLHPLAQLAAERLGDLTGESGGQAEILRRFGLNLTVAGDCTLLGTPSDVLPSGRQFEVLSTDELRSDAEGKLTRKRSRKGGTTGEDVPEDNTAVRVWRADPQYSDAADSPFRGVLDILEELVLLTRGVRATTTSRLAGAGLLIVAREIEYADGDPEADPDTEAADPFTKDLIDTMTTPISDKSSAAAVVPFVLRPPAEFCGSDFIRHIDWTRDFDGLPSVALRREAVVRFAQGIDLPVEIVTGHAQTTFSNAWQIDESTYKTHIEPGMALVCEALTSGYLHPAMKADKASPEDLNRLVVWFDPSELVVHPNRATDATALYDRFELAGAALRREAGFGDADAPKPAEVEERLAREAAQAAGQSAPAEAEDAAPGAGEVTEGELAAALAAAGEVTVRRAVERFGARLRSKASGPNANGIRDAIANVPNTEVSKVLGPSHVARLCPDADAWLLPELGAFREIAVDLCATAGLAPPAADRIVTLVASVLSERLYRSAPLDIPTVSAVLSAR